MDIEAIVRENRNRIERIHAHFDPITGMCSVGKRKEVYIKDIYPHTMYLPVSMMSNNLVKAIIKKGSIEQFCMSRYGYYDSEIREKTIRSFVKVRCRHDFPFCAYAYFQIKNKEGGKNIHFKLTYPQRYLLGILEDMRLNGMPIRIILLKARQWGGSTLVQMYIAWIQLFHKEGWYSVIVAQDGTTSRKIKAMYSKMLEKFPAWLIDAPDGAELSFTPYEGSQLDSIITYGKGTNVTVARDTVITVGTYNNPTSGRGGDMSCVHYSEVGLWEDTPGKTPESIIRSISSSLLIAPLTIEVIESTANGMGNFFYRAYTAAKNGESNRKAVFVPWFYIEMYEKQVDDSYAFSKFLLENKDNPNPPKGCLDSGIYYWHLWELGASLEAINWYMEKRKDYIEHADMAAEFPSDDVEAFKNSGSVVFSPYHIDKLKDTCLNHRFIGEVTGDGVTGETALYGLHFSEDYKGILKVWMLPDRRVDIAHRYIVAVDIGGRSNKADFSDIVVLDRYWMMYGGKPEVVAEWHGHIDHDLLAWKAAQIASFYNNAYLVIESNTIETKDNDTDGDQSEYIFNQLAGVYDNLYVRKASDAKIAKGITGEYGYHTNKKTKPKLISHLVACLRDGKYVERNVEVLKEYAVYEKKPNGSFGATEGNHDDRVMARAIALLVCFTEMEIPYIVKKMPKTNKTKSISEATTI